MDENIINEQNREEDLSEVLRIRREKLAQLRAEGHDPFTVMSYPVDHYSLDV